MFLYQLYGHLIGAEHELGGVPHETERLLGQKPDVVVSRCSLRSLEPDYAKIDEGGLSKTDYYEVYCDGDSTTIRQPGRSWLIRHSRGLEYYWREGDATLYCACEHSSETPALVFWCVHVVIPMILTFDRDAHFMHASAVESEHGALLFLAPSWGGKSTLADYAVKQGCRLLADDKAGLVEDSGAFRVVPSHPCHRPYRQYESLGMPARHYSPESASLSMMVILERNDSVDAPRIEQLDGKQGLASVLGNRVPTLMRDERASFQLSTAVARRVPIFRLSRPWGLEHLPAALVLLKKTQAGLA